MNKSREVAADSDATVDAEMGNEDTDVADVITQADVPDEGDAEAAVGAADGDSAPPQVPDEDDSGESARSDETQTDQAHGDESPSDAAAAPRQMIDPRGPRFGAAITVLVLAVALLAIPSIVAVILLVWQAIAFGAAALFGISAQPYGMLYRASVAPKLGPPAELEDAAPPRFAQQVGLVFVLVALGGLAFGVPLVAQLATALALAAAFLNAAFNFCLGCEIYLLAQRFRRA